MVTIRREVWIAASPGVVREHVTDPAKRRAWVGDDLGSGEDGGGADVVRFVRRDDAAESDVEISVEAAGEGSLVRVVETVTPADAQRDSTDAPTALARAA